MWVLGVNAVVGGMDGWMDHVSSFVSSRNDKCVCVCVRVYY